MQKKKKLVVKIGKRNLKGFQDLSPGISERKNKEDFSEKRKLKE